MSPDLANRCESISVLALKLWGRELQTICIQEELAELITAVSRAARGRGGAQINLLEEMADVQIIMKQLQVMYDIDDHALDLEIGEKLDKFERQVRNNL